MEMRYADEHERSDNKEAEKKILKYLFSAVNVLPRCANVPALKSHFLSRSDCLEEVNVPKKVFRARCKFCYQLFEEGAFALKVHPKKSPGKRMRRILKKASLGTVKLSRIEKKLLLNAEKSTGNKLVLKCLICQKETVKPMLKPPLIQRYIVTEVPEIVPEKKKKKKKKKKGKTDNAGLKIPAGMNVGFKRKKSQIASSAEQNPRKKKKKEEGLNIPAGMNVGTNIKKTHIANSAEPNPRKKNKAGLKIPAGMNVSFKRKKTQIASSAEQNPRKKKKKKEGLKIPAGMNVGTNIKKTQIASSAVLNPRKKKKKKHGLNLELKKVLLGAQESGNQKRKTEKKMQLLRAKLSKLQPGLQRSSLTSLFRDLGRKIV